MSRKLSFSGGHLVKCIMPADGIAGGFADHVTFHILGKDGQIQAVFESCQEAQQAEKHGVHTRSIRCGSSVF